MAILATILIIMNLPVLAPVNRMLYLERPEEINPYEAIIRAVTTVESGNGKFLLNETEMAVGWFGIRPVRLNDFNKKTGSHITLDECYGYETGRIIFLWYASQIDYRDIKAIAINWNGISKENKYYAKIQKVLVKEKL